MTLVGRRLVEFAANEHDDPDEHLLWPGAITRFGYGVHSFIDPCTGRKSSTTAHRAVLVLAAGGPPSEGRWEAAHRPLLGCPRHCINRRHLYWATPQQNADDQLLDRTRVPDPTTGRTRRADLVTQADVARLAGVGQPQVSRYLTGKLKNWTIRQRIEAAIDQLDYVKATSGRPRIEDDS